MTIDEKGVRPMSDSQHARQTATNIALAMVSQAFDILAWTNTSTFQGAPDDHD
jgi:hypothetical protein